MWDLFKQAGWVAYPLGLFSVIAVGIVLERLWTLTNLGRAEALAFAALQSNQTLDETAQTAPLARIVERVRQVENADSDTRERAGEIALAQERLRLRKYLAGLATIGSTAPFVGLFGTVLGVMSAFRSMGRAGLSGESMAAGIGEALSATALGLIVAIPAVFAYNYFVGRVQAFVLEVQSHYVRVAPALRQEVG